MLNTFYSPLRYPGGKTKIAPLIKEIFHENDLVGIDYIEPYAGGAGVALSLLIEGYVSKITINDYDFSIYAFWKSVTCHTERFCEKIRSIPVDMNSWYEQKEIQLKKRENNHFFELGFSTFFLNRTNISGIIKGGIIGGKSQKGKYKINARFNKEKLIKKIQLIGEHKDRIHITNQDAKHILQSNLDGKFLYIDPPYVQKAKDLYMNYYLEGDHKQISEALLGNKSKCYWVLSYDENELIHKLYVRCKNRISWNLNYGSSNRRGNENIFLHPNLKKLLRHYPPRLIHRQTHPQPHAPEYRHRQ